MKPYLIVGLGNIGTEYEGTRHNIGFEVATRIARRIDAPFETAKLGELAEGSYKGRKIFLLKPSTYMNLSGKAVRYWMEQKDVPVEHLLVITDDLNLPFGTLRLKIKGSDGGHNGLKDIQNQIQTTKYPRLRFGIGSEFSKGSQVSYVLGGWAEEEAKLLDERLERFTEAALSFVFAGAGNTMNQFNNT